MTSDATNHFFQMRQVALHEEVAFEWRHRLEEKLRAAGATKIDWLMDEMMVEGIDDAYVLLEIFMEHTQAVSAEVARRRQ